MFAVRVEETALDIVQDAMLKLSEKYSGKPPQEFPMLFQRILQNTIRDYYRRQKVRSLWTTLLSSLTSGDDDESDPLETLQSNNSINPADTPHGRLEQSQVLAIIGKEGEVVFLGFICLA